MYQVPTNTKKFRCLECNRDVNCIKWKTISNSLNKGPSYKCESCWENFDKEFEIFCNIKTKSIV